jgi:hypothetical protein
MGRAKAVSLALICASCATPSANPLSFGQAVSLCRVIADEQRFAGQAVLVRGLLVQTPHGRELYGPECNGSAELRGSSDLWDDAAGQVIAEAFSTNEHARVPVIVSGVFHPWTRHENGRPVINAGGAFIDEGRVVAAR